MLKRYAATAVAAGFGLLIVACSHDQNARPVEGTPGATTNQASGYDASDPNHYHPQSDDTRQYHPADASSVQPK